MNYYATVLHTFGASSDRELGLKAGDKVLLFNWDDPEWWYGELNGRSGYFPSSHVELLAEEEDDDVPPPPPPPPIEDDDDAPPPPPPGADYAVGLWDCSGETDHELSFRAGDRLLVLEDSSNEWLFVELRDKRGYVPRNFVDYMPSSSPARPSAPKATSKPKRPDTSTLPRNAGNDENKVVAIYDFPALTAHQLSLKAGDFVNVLDKNGEWWKGELNGKTGLFPKTYVDIPSAAAFALIEKNNRDDAIVTPPPVPMSSGSFITQNPNANRSNNKISVPEPEPEPQSIPTKISSITTTQRTSPNTTAANVTKTTTATVATKPPAAVVTAPKAAPTPTSSTTTSTAPKAAPAARSGKICQACQGAITGAFMDIDEAYYHKSCFVCALCSSPLKKFFDREGKIYCGDCFSNKVDVTPCGRCGKPLGADVVKACGKRFHDECFTCFNCKAPFHDNLINNRDGQPWCDTCVRQVVPKSNPLNRSAAPPKNNTSSKATPSSVVSAPAGKKTRQVPSKFQQQKMKYVSGFD